MIFLLLACQGAEKHIEDLVFTTPSDDPAHYQVDTSILYDIETSSPQWIIPGENLPVEITPAASNNNVDIHFFQDRLFIAWRSSPTHFAGDETTMWIMSSADQGATWEYETHIAMDADVREPRFVSSEDMLQFSYFEAGTNPAAFEPKQLWRIFRQAGQWSSPEVFGEEKSVLWDIKYRNGLFYMTTYDGGHYSADEPVYVRFWSSLDGIDWSFVNGKEAVYVGGVSEVAFEFDSVGNLWAVGRNEDGDETGAGTQICFAPVQDLSAWECLQHSDPERYDSPEMFRHGDQIYLLGRIDRGGTFGPDGDLISYSLRPKGFGLFRLNQDSFTLELINELPGVGDTSFPSVRRVSENHFLFANYTSPLDDPDISWFEAQMSSRGTQIYLMNLYFIPQ